MVPANDESTNDGDLMTFTGMNQASDLQIHNGRAIAVYAGGKFVRIYDLAGQAAPGEPLATGGNGSVAIRTVGQHVYISNGPNALVLQHRRSERSFRNNAVRF